MFYMKKVIIIGAFANGYNLLQGQTVKTRIIADEIENKYGSNQVGRIDTYGTLNHIICLFKCALAFFRYNNIIMMPGINGLKIFGPWLAMWNKIFYRKLHYIVIGGWLDNCLNDNPRLERALHEFHEIYVETQKMMNALQKRGFTNISILPNCKNLKILNKDELIYTNTEPYHLVTFSQVLKEKGIEDAILAVNKANSKIGKDVFELTIYGQIGSSQTEWFETIKEKYDLDNPKSTINYGGSIPYDKSTDILKNSFSLLFPTYYEGEGLAGTLIDAFAAGIPIIASDWKYNDEIVKDDRTGKLFPVHDINAMVNILIWAYNHLEEWNKMKILCIEEAEKYLPQIALKGLYIKLI